MEPHRDPRQVVPHSHSAQNRILEHRLKAEDMENENTWKSMCLVMDKRAVQYFTQVMAIFSVMVLCIYKLATDPSCEAQQVYTGLLTLVIGILAPAPTFK